MKRYDFFGVGKRQIGSCEKARRAIVRRDNCGRETSGPREESQHVAILMLDGLRCTVLGEVDEVPDYEIQKIGKALAVRRETIDLGKLVTFDPMNAVWH